VYLFIPYPDRDVGHQLPFQFRKMLLSTILLKKALCNYYLNERESWIAWVLSEVGDICIFMCRLQDYTMLLTLVSLSPPFFSLYLLGQA